MTEDQDVFRPGGYAAEEGARPPAAPAMPPADVEALYQVVAGRRDIRNGFLPDPVADDVLTRVLTAAHQAPSVGLSQPWDFIVLRDRAAREQAHALARQQQEVFAAGLPGPRARAFRELKVEAILDTPLNVVVTCDSTRGGRHVLGRHAQPQVAAYSTACAVQNLWLAARAEGLGVGWVSFFDERELAAALGLPAHLQVVAYLCVGHVEAFPPAPELVLSGWARRRPLSWAVHEGQWGRRGLPGAPPASLIADTVAAIRPLDAEAVAQARERQEALTKPSGSLGVLEQVSVQLAGLAGECPPPLPEPAVVAVFAGDHGVHAQGVTPWPQEVTAQMVANFLASGAVVNAIAAQAGAEVCVVDVGVAADLPAAPGLLPRKIRPGTADMTTGPGHDPGRGPARRRGGHRDRARPGRGGQLLPADRGHGHREHDRVGRPDRRVHRVGAGAGHRPGHRHRRPDLAAEGRGRPPRPGTQPSRSRRPAGRPRRGGRPGARRAGRLHPGRRGAAGAGRAGRGHRLRRRAGRPGPGPGRLGALLAGHLSTEPGARRALDALGLRPLLDLGLRLGEGSGAALALPVVAAAARVLRDVATFDSAGVSGEKG